VAITEADYEALAALANEQGVRVSEILRKAIAEYLKKSAKKNLQKNLISLENTIDNNQTIRYII